MTPWSKPNSSMHMLQEKMVAHARALPLKCKRDMSFAIEKKLELNHCEMRCLLLNVDLVEEQHLIDRQLKGSLLIRQRSTPVFTWLWNME
jgi:hypothetical protein